MAERALVNKVLGTIAQAAAETATDAAANGQDLKARIALKVSGVANDANVAIINARDRKAKDQKGNK